MLRGRFADGRRVLAAVMLPMFYDTQRGPLGAVCVLATC